jgi:hypothetical protein
MKYNGLILRLVLDKAKPTIILLKNKKKCQIKVFTYDIFININYLLLLVFIYHFYNNYTMNNTKLLKNMP